jgi:3-methyladenine DNA glycosylase Tag
MLKIGGTEEKDLQIMMANLRTSPESFINWLNWNVFNNKWPMIKQAFCNFNIKAIRSFSPADEQRLLNDRGTTTNKYKIHAI